MKILTLVFLVFGAFVAPRPVEAQDTHVRTRYVEKSQTTVVETDWMYLINTRQQFLQLGLMTRYQGERLEKPPAKVELVIWSFSRQALYGESKVPTLNINTDGESWSVKAQARLAFKGETKNGQDIFWNEKRPDIGEPSLLPKTAQVKNGGGISGLFMEQVYFELKPEQLHKLAGAKKLEMQVGQTRLELTNDYLGTIREFDSRLVHGAQPAGEAEAKPVVSPLQKSDKLPDVGVVNGKALSLPRPAYSDLAKNVGASGRVDVFVTIDETGKVVAARAINGHPLLREPSEDAAKNARFSPPLVGGKPVKVTGIIIYNFMR